MAEQVFPGLGEDAGSMLDGALDALLVSVASDAEKTLHNKQGAASGSHDDGAGNNNNSRRSRRGLAGLSPVVVEDSDVEMEDADSFLDTPGFQQTVGLFAEAAMEGVEEFASTADGATIGDDDADWADISDLLGMAGRMGPRVVTFDLERSFAPFVLDGAPWVVRPDKNEAESHCNFITLRANAAVSSGKWMYEVQLRTAGVQQIGWCMAGSRFSNEEGVGDEIDTYAFDGKRKKKWNVANRTYGENWTPGDVIGVCLDADVGEIEFFRNGVSLGTAFRNVRLGPGYAYFPALSLSYSERSRLNFGAMPFRFPVPGFHALQLPPVGNVAKAKYLLQSFDRMFNTASAPSAHTAALFSAHIFDRLGPLLCDPYVVSDALYPFLFDAFKTSESHLAKVLGHLFAFLEENELRAATHQIFDHLADTCRLTTLWDDPQTRQFCLALLKLPQCLFMFVKSTDFKDQLEGLLTTKLISPEDLPRMFPSAWWEGAPEEYSQERCEKEREAMCKRIQATADMHVALVSRFLDDDVPLISLSAGSPKRSPRWLFLDWLRKLVQHNSVLRRQVVPPGVSDPTVLQNTYYAVCHWLMTSAASPEEWVRTNVPDRVFVDESLDHADAALIGGTLSHVRSELKAKIESGEVAALPEGKQECSVALQVYDHACSLFSLSLPSALRRLRQANADMVTAIKGFHKELSIYNRCPPDQTEARKMLEHACQVFVKQSAETVRTALAYRQTYLSCGRDECFLWWMTVSLNLLKRQGELPYLEFLPETYVEIVIDCYMTLKSTGKLGCATVEPFWTTSAEREALLISFARFFIGLVDRIVSPDLAGSCAVAVRSVFAIPEHVRVFERVEGLPRLLISSQMKSFSGRFWVPSTDVLIRFWFRTGFAFWACRKAGGSSDDTGLECASPKFRQELKNISMEETGLFFSFINSLLNHLNLAVTEFDAAIQEIRQATTTLDRGGAEQQERYRKCNMMCEISVGLLRLLEAVVNEAPEAFSRESTDAETNLSRVVEVVAHLFCRVTTSNTYGSIMDSSSGAAMQSVDRLLLISPLVGTLMGLLKLSSDKPRVRSLVLSGVFENPAFSAKVLDFLLGDQLAFQQHEGIEATEVEQLETLVTSLKEELIAHDERKQQAAEEEETSTAEDDLCTICYAYPLSATFQPCMHRSCSRCITRHLLNNTKCFFCNAEVEQVVEDEEGAAGVEDAGPAAATAKTPETTPSKIIRSGSTVTTSTL
eukprot:m.134270 g.134270  ORF g.134270 m.134270 type:complete len:1230 (-) comp16913_c0_seq1:391-4080(-)